ncbi:MAG TPA: RidA family protein [Saprospiraceae bacterium]|nr:RidA family protein [Saprospiraceae bacterium]
MRENYKTGAKWESIMSYSRAIRVNDVIEVSGTTSLDGDGNILFANDPFLQTQEILKIIERSISALGGRKQDIVRTRIFVKNIDDWQLIAKAHGEFFVGINPVCTMVEIARLIEPELVVEIEGTAIISID